MYKIDSQPSYMVLLENLKFIEKFWLPQKNTSLVWVGALKGGLEIDYENKQQEEIQDLSLQD